MKYSRKEIDNTGKLLLTSTDEYAKLEEGLQDGKNAAVLVSVNKVKKLRKAYPSYFLDTKEFTNNIDKICHNCEVRNLL